MHPTFEAALHLTRDSFAMLSDAIDGLPDGALDWDARFRHELARRAPRPRDYGDALLSRGSGATESVAGGYREQERASPPSGRADDDEGPAEPLEHAGGSRREMAKGRHR